MCKWGDRETLEGGTQGGGFFLREMETRVEDGFKERIANHVKYLREAEWDKPEKPFQHC